MSDTQRDTTKNFTLRIEPELLAAIHALAERNGRSVSGEIVSAIRRHLASPPTILEVAAKLPDEDLTKHKPRKSKGGKPFGGGYEAPPRKNKKPKAEGDASETE